MRDVPYSVEVRQSTPLCIYRGGFIGILGSHELRADTSVSLESLNQPDTLRSLLCQLKFLVFTNNMMKRAHWNAWLI